MELLLTKASIIKYFSQNHSQTYSKVFDKNFENCFQRFKESLKIILKQSYKKMIILIFQNIFFIHIILPKNIVNELAKCK